MRRAAGWVGGVVGWLALAGGLAAEEKDATVRTPTAEVRGGPSAIFPITGYLRQGQTVHTTGEDGDYYAVAPPAGSVSWIEDHAIQPHVPPGAGRPDRAHVLLDNVAVRLGSDRVPTPLNYERVKVPRGTIVRIIGDKAFAEGKEWWPIQPPPTEMRYVAKTALTPQTTTVTSASPVNPAGPPAGPNQPTNPRWVEAQQAERVHDYARAEALYRQLAGEQALPGGDHDLAIRCYNRIEQLTRSQTSTWPARQPAPGMLVGGRPVSPAPPPPPPGAAISSGPGWLRRTGIPIDGKTAYVIEDNRGQAKYYVVAQAGLYPGLEQFVNRSVDVSGPLVPRNDLVGGGYIVVNRVQYLR